MERKFQFTIGEYYHIFNRGVDKSLIFNVDKDFDRFQGLLYLANGDRPVVSRLIRESPFDWERGNIQASILAYSLMPNHFHLICREEKSGGLSKLLGKLSTSYSMYFNTKYERSGSLLCHPFRARHIDSDDYFRWVFSYVHLNPLDIMKPGSLKRKEIDYAQSIQFLESFSYSSYTDYFNEGRPAGRIINKEALPIEAKEIENVEEMIRDFQSIPKEFNLPVR